MAFLVAVRVAECVAVCVTVCVAVCVAVFVANVCFANIVRGDKLCGLTAVKSRKSRPPSL